MKLEKLSGRDKVSVHSIANKINEVIEYLSESEKEGENKDEDKREEA